MSDDSNATSNNIEPSSVFSEQDKELATKAKQEFEGAQFDGTLTMHHCQTIITHGLPLVCLKSLQKLLESFPNDPKVLFNIALTEYAMSSFQKTDLFKTQLNKIAEKVVTSPSPSFPPSNDRSLSVQLHCALDNVSTLEEVDQCTLFYNMAVLLHHMRQYQAALVIAKKLFRFVGQIGRRCSMVSASATLSIF